MNMILPRGIYLAPMVSASELAFRMLVRKCGNASLCYSPMLRANDVISVANNSKKYMNTEFKVEIDKAGRTDSVEETAYLLLQDQHPEDTKSLVVQLCGSCPDKLFTATTSIMDLYSHNSQQPFGIDLNLGCPQLCAEKEGFGAFLVEKSLDLAISCISSMRRAIDTYASKTNNVKRPFLSAKIRLLDTGVDDTIEFIRRLKAAGLDYLAIHCRNRAAKHDGLADHEAGSRIVDAFDDFPIILNGGISDYNTPAERVIQQTNCHAVMIATGYLRDHSLSNNSHNVANLALEYLDYAEE